nr:CopD family protein [Nevskia sp.]
MARAMLWMKAFHVIFMVSWFAALFYLPRLFVYHCDVTDDAGHERFVTMERKLYGIGLIAMIGTWVFGIATILAAEPAYLKAVYVDMKWLHPKVLLALLLSGYYGWLKSVIRKFAARANTKSHKFYRLINEVPAVLLVAIVILVIVKPF